jgi:hypothetical protein
VLVELIAVKWLRGTTLSQVHNPDNLPAVSYIYDVLASGLRQTLVNAFILALSVLVICLFLGHAAWVAAVRHIVRLDRLGASRVGGWGHAARQWLWQWKYYLWLGIAVIVLAYMAFVTAINLQIVANALLLIIGLWAAVYIAATPHPYRRNA